MRKDKRKHKIVTVKMDTVTLNGVTSEVYMDMQPESKGRPNLSGTRWISKNQDRCTEVWGPGYRGTWEGVDVEDTALKIGRTFTQRNKAFIKKSRM